VILVAETLAHCYRPPSKKNKGKGPNDREDRRIRSSLLWLKQHWQENGVDLTLVHLSEDSAHIDECQKNGIHALTGTVLYFLG